MRPTAVAVCLLASWSVVSGASAPGAHIREKRFLTSIRNTLDSAINAARSELEQAANTATQHIDTAIDQAIGQAPEHFQDTLNAVRNATEQILRNGEVPPNIDRIGTDLVNAIKKTVMDLGRGCLATWIENIGTPSSLNLSCITQGLSSAQSASAPASGAHSFAAVSQGTCQSEAMGTSTMTVCMSDTNEQTVSMHGQDPVCVNVATTGTGPVETICSPNVELAAVEVAPGLRVYQPRQEIITEVRGGRPTAIGDVNGVSNVVLSTGLLVLVTTVVSFF